MPGQSQSGRDSAELTAFGRRFCFWGIPRFAFHFQDIQWGIPALRRMTARGDTFFNRSYVNFCTGAVHAGGAAAIAGIEPGDILLNVDGREITPSEHPVFAIGKQTSVEFVDRNDQRRTVSVEVARPKGKKLHFTEPTLVEARLLGDSLGYLKIAMFPGMIGVEVANEISGAVEKLDAIDSLIIDLRGNTGGGIGALRVMSTITPGRVPVGFASDRHRVTANLESEKHSFHRFSQIPASTKTLWRLAFQFGPAMMAKKPIVLQTEGLGEKPFHGG
jgi:membrane-associated protease RseP (regulator of RpoE activity)